MELYPTTTIAKAAAKALKGLGEVLHPELARFIRDEFLKDIAKWATPEHLREVIGRYFKAKGNRYLASVPTSEKTSK